MEAGGPLPPPPSSLHLLSVQVQSLSPHPQASLSLHTFLRHGLMRFFLSHNIPQLHKEKVISLWK